jgi:biotin carboxylase
MPKKYLLVVNHIVGSVVSAVEQMRADKAYADLQILVITDMPDFEKKYSRYLNDLEVIHCDYESPKDLAEKLSPYYESICGVVCRGDKYIQYLRKLAQVLPPSVLVATPKALEASTNKYAMRHAFKQNAPDISPKFIEVADDTKKSIEMIESELSYPVIVKPANLFSSLLIQSCQSRSELEKALKDVFRQIKDVYKASGIKDKPQVIVEDYLEGDFYSIDAYVMNAGQVYFCPPVGYVPASQVGIDDFFLYKRFIPTDLTAGQIEAANQAVKKSLMAVGLTHSSAHVELIFNGKDWKIIEIGPRLGRFRHLMYQQAYAIDHSLNDLKIHLGIPPEIPKTLLRHCNAYSIYPREEGRLKSIAGIDKLHSDPMVKWQKSYSKPGDKCLFAKHGGHALAEFIIASDERKEFKKLTDYIETKIFAIID